MNSVATSPVDLRLLCAALGFTAVVLKGDDKKPDHAGRAKRLAGLIEAFCVYSTTGPVDQNQLVALDGMIDALKTDLRERESADLEKPRETLIMLYDRLRDRYAVYATDDMIADRVLELLDWELEYNDRPSAQ